jgi:glycosyltransferase involved in cell wall biosynthesis
MNTILLIGPLENKKDPTKTGGIIVLFLDLLHQFNQCKINYAIIDTNKENYSHKVIALLSIWYQILIKVRQFNHISLHGTANDYIFIAPFAVFIAKLLGKTVSLRKFAGNFDDVYLSMNSILKSAVSYALRYSNANFFETKYLVNYFSKFNPHTYWFPNVRAKPVQLRSGPYQKKFVFIGTITKEKGVIELLEASNLLDETYVIHLYGPIAKDMDGFNFSTYRAVYQKALRPNEVLETLRAYDVLILPSYREGYPGIIIEALSVGLPIITTDLAGIKEMLDEKCAIFIRPENTKDIKNSVIGFNRDNYNYFSKNAIKCFELFNSDIQTPKFIQTIFRGETSF